MILASGRLLFSESEREGYVHWFGKGPTGDAEWTFRIYSADNTAQPYRANRISVYVFNLAGGLGAGSHFQDQVVPGQWIHVVGVVRTSNETIAISKNGVQRDQDSFADTSNFHVIPENGTTPVRIGTRDLNSFFAGAVDDIRVYNRALSAQEILQLSMEQASELPGDFNRDGSVDVADYIPWRKGLNTIYSQTD